MIKLSESLSNTLINQLFQAFTTDQATLKLSLDDNGLLTVKPISSKDLFKVSYKANLKPSKTI